MALNLICLIYHVTSISLSSTPLFCFCLPISLIWTPLFCFCLPISLICTPLFCFCLPISLILTPLFCLCLPISLIWTPLFRFCLPLSLIWDSLISISLHSPYDGCEHVPFVFSNLVLHTIQWFDYVVTIRLVYTFPWIKLSTSRWMDKV